MRVGFVGGWRDGHVVDVPEPLPPALRYPEPIRDPVSAALSFRITSPVDVSPSFVIVQYRLARRIKDHKPFYVEEGVLDRWYQV